MPVTPANLELRPASPDDAGIVADLMTVRDPDEPRDPVVQRHWWAVSDENEICMRRVAVRDGAAVAYVSARHDPWNTTEKRFSTLTAVLHPDLWSEEHFVGLVRIAEDWMRDEGVKTSVARTRENFTNELAAYDRVGYREDRRMRTSELDLVQRHDEITRTVEECRVRMRNQGVQLLTLDRDGDPERMAKLYEMTLEAEQDIPTTAPWRVLGFDEWKRLWFHNPGIREDRFWIARENDRIIGMSALDFPVTRGVPYTALTGTARSVRGRGIARALKYESMNQAIELGFTRVRTVNDADNAPILHINVAMGYRLVVPIIELHRDLTA